MTVLDTPGDVDGQATALVGRSTELQIVRRLVQRAQVASASLLVWGDAGIGKSALLDAAARQAAALGTDVITVAGCEFETDIAYAGIQQLTVPLWRELPRLPRPAREDLLAATGFGGTRPVARSDVIEAVASLLRCATRARPLLLVVDDAQWFDRSSVAVLRELAVRADLPRLGILGAVRDTGPDRLPLPGMPALELGPLDETAAAELLDARFPDMTSEQRLRVQRQAAGNPLALLELPGVLESWGLGDTTGLPAPGGIGDRLKTLFGHKLSALPAATSRILLLAALDGQASLSVLAKASPGTPVVDVLRPAVEAGLASVDATTRRVTFRHPLAGAAVVERAVGPERRDAHRALAAAMSDRPDRLVQRAWHLACASLAPDESVAELLDTAARTLVSRGDVAGAVVMLVRAADLSTEEGSRACRLASAAYYSADGDLDRAGQLAAATRRSTGTPAAALGAAAAGALVLLRRDGDVGSAHRLITTAIAHYPRRHDPQDSMLVNALHALDSICWYGERPELWHAYYEAIARLRPGLPPSLALTTGTSSDPARASAADLRDLTTAIASLDGEADPDQVFRVVHTASCFDRIGECRTTLSRLIAGKQNDGALGMTIQALLMLGLDDLKRGQWPATRRYANDALALSVEHGHGLLVWAAQYELAVIAAARGESEAVARLTDEMVRWATPRGVNTVHSYVAHVRATEAAGRGDFEAAYRHAASISPPGTLASHVPMALTVPLYLVDAALRTGRRAEAAAHAEALENADIAKLCPRLALAQHTCSAAVAEGETARRGFERALAVPGAETWAFDHAQVLLMFGSHLRRQHSVAASREPLGQAAAAFERLGAEPWAARARGELGATARRRVSSSDRHLRTLTPQEHEVARLAASGLSNRKIAERLYISHRTVSNHLYQVFPKLGVSSRAALRDALGPESIP